MRRKREVANHSDNSVYVFGTVLFFDEANTSEHINLIKEIMCDGTVLGRKIDKDLKVVAACNPYRKLEINIFDAYFMYYRHSSEMIARLESAGLGFSTKSLESQKFGRF